MKRIDFIKTNVEVSRGSDGRLYKFERRGIRKVVYPVTDDGASLTSLDGPSLASQETAEMLEAANKALSDAGEKALDWLVAEIDRRGGGEEVYYDVCYDWMSDIKGRYNHLSPLFMACDFVAQLGCLGFTKEGGSKQWQSITALPDDLDAILCFTRVWHYWHMEVYGEHYRAYRGLQAQENLSEGRSAASNKAKERLDLVERERDALWLTSGNKRGNLNATAIRLFDQKINDKLIKAGHKPYASADALRKALSLLDD